MRSVHRLIVEDDSIDTKIHTDRLNKNQIQIYIRTHAKFALVQHQITDVRTHWFCSERDIIFNWFENHPLDFLVMSLLSAADGSKCDDPTDWNVIVCAFHWSSHYIWFLEKPNINSMRANSSIGKFGGGLATNCPQSAPQLATRKLLPKTSRHWKLFN